MTLDHYIFLPQCPHISRSHLPLLGYIIDISRNGQNGEESTTRTTVSTETPVSSGFLGGLEAFGGGLAGLLRGDPDNGGEESQERASATGSKSSDGNKEGKDVKPTPSMPSASGEEKMDVDEKGGTEERCSHFAAEKEKKKDGDDDDRDNHGNDKTRQRLAQQAGELITGTAGKQGMYVSSSLPIHCTYIIIINTMVLPRLT